MNEIFFRSYTLAYKIKRYIRLWRDALRNAWVTVHLSEKYDELFFQEHVKERSNKIPKQYRHLLNTIDYYLFLIKYSNSQLLTRKICISKREYQLSDQQLLALISYCESELVNLAQKINLVDEIDDTYRIKISNCQKMAESIRRVISVKSNFFESQSDSESSK